MDLQTGDILHCKGSSLISRLIMRFTKGKYSHTAIVVECWGIICIVEAQNNGVNLKSYNSWVKKYNYNYVISRPLLVDKHDFSKKILSKIGVTSYDFKSLIFYQPLYLITGKWKGSSEEDNKNYCSDLAGWSHGFLNYWKMSPQDLYKYVNTLSTFKLIE